MPSTSLSLLDRVRCNDNSDSWSRLTLLYSPWLENLFQQAGISIDERDDLRQDVFAIVCREISDFQHNGQAGAFRRWLRTITMNRLNRYWRQRQKATEQIVTAELELIPDRIRDLEAAWDREHDQFVLRELLKQAELSFAESTWKAFSLQVLHNWDAPSTAVEVGISINAALIAKSRVLQRLRDEGNGILDDM